MSSVNDLMGKIVLVDKIFVRVTNRNPRMSNRYPRKSKTWEIQEATGRPGWVVGERWLQNGEVELGFGYEDPPVWHKTSCVHALLVTYWPSMKAVPVPFDGFRTAPPTIRPYRSPDIWPESARDFMRQEMQDWPRDAKGRWIKKKS